MTKDIYREFFNTMANLVSFNEIVYSGIQAVDYRILKVNPAFENCLGIPGAKIVNKLASDIYQETPPRDIEIYAEISRSGVPRHFKTYLKRIDKHFIISATSPEKGKFIAVFSDISQYAQTCVEQEEMINALQAKLKKTRTLSGLIPICSNCKKIREKQGSWTQVESFISRYSDVRFTHGICPDCMKLLYPGFIIEEQNEEEEQH